jgi:hypothetical protein
MIANPVFKFPTNSGTLDFRRSREGRGLPVFGTRLQDAAPGKEPSFNDMEQLIVSCLGLLPDGRGPDSMIRAQQQYMQQATEFFLNTSGRSFPLPLVSAPSLRHI